MSTTPSVKHGGVAGQRSKPVTAIDVRVMTEAAILRCIEPGAAAALIKQLHPSEFRAGQMIFAQGDPGDWVYIIVSGNCAMERHGARIGLLASGDCFGEASYVQGAKRTATILAADDVTVLKVSSTLLEQVSASCQLRFNRVFLRSLISRLQSTELRP